MEMTPDVKAALEKQKETCIFCKIISGETEGKIVYKDKHCIGVLDINPVVKGHTLLCPKEHYPIMPYMPADVFKHMFGLMPKLIKAYKDALLMTGANVFIANGGIAGQNAPHFLVHILPRECGDKANKFALDKTIPLDAKQMEEASKLLANNIPLMMQNHFQRNPAKWCSGKVERPEHLKNAQGVLYEDQKVMVLIPQKPQCKGHLLVISKEEDSLIENLSTESSSHLFYTASFCATAVFEGLGAQGTNIILKTGKSDDNLDAALCIHILPRWENDGIDVLNEPLKEKPNLDDIAKQIKDKTFEVEHSFKKKEEPIVIDMDAKKEKIGPPKNDKEEILAAIRKIRGN